MRTCLALIVALLTLAASAQAQSIEAQRRELERLRSSMNATKQRIDELARKEKATASSISGIQKQAHSVSAFIVQLEQELHRLQDSASAVERHIASTRASLVQVRTRFNEASRRVMALKAESRGSASSATTSDAMYRTAAAAVSAYARQMAALEDSLEAQQQLLTTVSSVQSGLLSTKEQERQRLASTITARQRELARLRADKSEMARELRKKQASVAQMRRIISDLVAREERRRRDDQRKAAAAAAARRRAAAASPSTSSRPTEDVAPDVITGGPLRPGFSARSLPWPVSSRRIAQPYGEYRSPESGTILDNPGVDIACAVGTDVACVGPGTVSSVRWLPGFGSVVIVDHHNGYRTVYANLQSVRVREGATVNGGSTVGSSGEGIDGAFVHFELWRGRERVNPATYLR